MDIEGGILKELSFLGRGCRGNSYLICKILQGKRIEELIPLLKDIPCREGTSCPDQVAKALELDQKEGLPTMKDIPGCSEYGKYGADINAIIYLSNYLRDEYVSPIFETLAKQFWAHLYLFNHSDAPLYKFLANRHFVNVGNINPTGGARGSFAILEAKGD